MRKHVFGRQFKRTKNQRAALFKGLITSLILHGKIQTTYEKAKAIKGDVDKIITRAKKGDVEGKRLLSPILPLEAVEKVLVIARTFSKRNGGYTRVIKLGRRFSDSASVAAMEWVEGNEVESSKLKVQNVNKVEEVISTKGKLPKKQKANIKVTKKSVSKTKKQVEEK